MGIQKEWDSLKHTLALANSTRETTSEQFGAELRSAMVRTVEKCRSSRKRERAKETDRSISDTELSKLARFTDALPFANYEGVLHLVPRLVNVVTVRVPPIRWASSPFPPSRRAQLAEAIPVPGLGRKLPLNLHEIAARCTNSYFAPRRFAAVQLAFDSPRCRVLIFRKFASLKLTHSHPPVFDPRRCLCHARAVGRC